MQSTTSDRSAFGDLSSLIQNAAFLRLRLRNVNCSNNKPLPEEDGDFLVPNTPAWADTEDRFYKRIREMKTLLLNGNNTLKTLKSLSLGDRFPLAALLRIYLDNRNLVTNDPLPKASPYYQPQDKSWTILDRYWHQLRDQVGNELYPQLEQWVIKKPTYHIKLEPEDFYEAIHRVWEYLNLSLSGQPTVKGNDSVFNPYYRQKHEQKTTIKAWLGIRLGGAVITVAKEKKEFLMGKNAWWEIIRGSVADEFAQELENIKLDGQDHINAKQVILNRLPVRNGQGLAQQLNCDQTTLDQFYEDHCFPWLVKRFSKFQEKLQKHKDGKLLTTDLSLKIVNPIATDPATGEEINPLENVADSRSSQPWWEIVREAVTGEFFQELENLKPRSKRLHHINAKLVILNRLPPVQDWEDLASAWNCDRTTLERFYKDHCAPWLVDHFEELRDLL
jgi:hypothetical protein